MRKKLTDDVLRSIRADREEEGLTITQIMEKYGLSKGSASKAIRGCRSDKVPPRKTGSRGPLVPEVEPNKRPHLSTTDMGEAVRRLAVGRLLLEGMSPFYPARESTPVDLLILREDGRVLKCQCKYIYPDRQGGHRFSFTHQCPGPRGKRVSTRYEEGEVDYFIGYCLDNDSFYIIPWSDTGGRKELRLWVLRAPFGGHGRAHVSDPEPYRDAFSLLR